MEDRKGTPQLDASRFKSAEHERNVHSICVEEFISRAQIINPAFLAHIAAKLRPYDEILVRCDDGTIFARLLVLQAERTWARVHITEWHDLTTRDVAQTQTETSEQVAEKVAEFRVEYKGSHKKWCIIRNTDGAIVREDEATKALANQWLDGYVKVIA